jgi:hypothetical protein
VRLAIRAKRPFRLVRENVTVSDSFSSLRRGIVLSRGFDGGGAFDWRPRLSRVS